MNCNYWSNLHLFFIPMLLSRLRIQKDYKVDSRKYKLYFLCAFGYAVFGFRMLVYSSYLIYICISLMNMCHLERIEHLILNAIAQLAHKLLILLKGAKIVDLSQGTQMNIVLAFYQNGRSLIEEMLILIVGENSTVRSKF